MNITFACDKCGRTMTVNETNTGMTVKCPACDGIVAVPTPVRPRAAPIPIPITSSSNRKRTMIWVAVGIMPVCVLVFLVALTNSDNHLQSGQSPSYVDKAVAEEIVLPKMKLRVTFFKKVRWQGFLEAPHPDTKFVEADISVTNNTTSSFGLFDFPILVDDKGRQYQPTVNFTSQTFAPGIAERGTLLYEIPADVSTCSIHIDSQFDRFERVKQPGRKIYRINLDIRKEELLAKFAHLPRFPKDEQFPLLLAIEVRADGSIFVNDVLYDDPKSRELPQLRSKIQLLLDTDPNVPVVILSSQGAQRERLDEVTEACRDAGVTKLFASDSDPFGR